MSLLQAVISSESQPLKPEPPATLRQAGQLLGLLLIAFVGTILAVWIVIRFARMLKRNAARKPEDTPPPGA